MVNRFKKNINFIIMFFVICFIGMIKVSAINDYTSGAAGSGGSTTSGSYNGLTGIRVAVVDSSGKIVSGTHVADVISTKDLANNSHNYYVFKSQATKIQYKTGTTLNNTRVLAISKSSNAAQNDNYVYNVSVTGAENFGDYLLDSPLPNNGLSSYLSKNEYNNLKKIVSMTGYECLDQPTKSYCNKNQYVIVEPLIQFDEDIVTGYEMTTKYNYDGNYRGIYINMANTIYLQTQPTNFTYINVCNYGALSNSGTYSYNALSYVGEGCGIGIYNVNTINTNIPEPQINKLTIKKVNESGTALSGVNFNFSVLNKGGQKTTNNSGQITFNDVGTYTLTEIVPSGYDGTLTTCSPASVCTISSKTKDSVVFKINFTGGDVTVTITNKKIQKGTLQITKVKTSGVTITGKSTKFRLYSGSSCNESNNLNDFYIGGTGKTTLTLDAGNYSIKEISPPSGYAIEKDADGNNKCYNFTIKAGEASLPLSIKNPQTCESEFEALSDPNDPVERIALYKKYGFTNLLNFYLSEPTDASIACSNNTYCDNSVELGCLSAKTSDERFDEGDVSCFTYKYEVNNVPVFCRETLSLGNNLSGTDAYRFTSSYDFSKNKFITPGQMIFSREESKKNIAQGLVTVTCYAYDINQNFQYSANTSFTNFVRSISFNGKKLNGEEVQDSSTTQKIYSSYLKTNYTKISKTFKMNYYLNSVYAKNGTGKVQTSYCLNCKFLGYGVVSKLTDKKGTVYGIPFSITLKSVNGKKGTQNAEDKACAYKVSGDKFVEPLKLQFRIIDTSNPFPSKDGDGRQVGDNWCSKNFDLNYNGAVQYYDKWMIMNNKCITVATCDLSKNGKIDDIDIELINEALGNSRINTVGKNCDSNNIYASYIMEKTNNSYNKNKTGAKYKITLTPSDIKLIRTYNSKTTYDDYKFKCTDGENCTSNFLTQLKNGSLTGIGSLSNKLIYKG